MGGGGGGDSFVGTQWPAQCGVKITRGCKHVVNSPSGEGEVFIPGHDMQRKTWACGVMNSTPLLICQQGGWNIDGSSRNFFLGQSYCMGEEYCGYPWKAKE